MSTHCNAKPIFTRLFPAIVAMTFAPWLTVQAAHPGHDVIGEWKLTSVLDGVEITSIDENQARHLLGQVMTIQKEGTRFGSESCGAPSFYSKRVEPNQYVRQEAHISAAKLRLPNPVTVVDLGCTRVFIKRADEAVIFWDGFFFGARKIKPSKAAPR